MIACSGVAFVDHTVRYQTSLRSVCVSDSTFWFKTSGRFQEKFPIPVGLKATPAWSWLTLAAACCTLERRIPGIGPANESSA